MGKYYSRKFLNSKRGTALIEVSGEIQSNWTDGSVVFTDCNRRVDLSFSYGRKKSKTEKLKKLALIIKELQEFEKFLKNGNIGDGRDE